jgi:hypothetical protein
MRVAAGRALAAARSIAQMEWRVDMALLKTLVSTVRVAEQGKVRVNRLLEGHAFSGKRRSKSSAR